MPPPTDWRDVLLVSAALRTGLLAACDRPGTPEERAVACGLDARATGIVIRALQDSGYLTPDSEGATLTPAGREQAIGPDDHPEDAGAAVLFEARAIAAWAHLEQALRTGMPADDMSGGDPDTRRRFLRAMRRVAAPRVPHTVEALGAPTGAGRLLDVGGAPGSYAQGFAAAGWRVAVMDLPDTLEIGAPDLRAVGVELIPGDVLADGIPAGPWDAVYLGNVLHLFGADDAAAVVADAASRLSPGGRLAVQEVLGDRAPQGPSFGVMMLTGTAGGDAYPERAYRRWMAAAGVPVERVVELDDGQHHLMIGHVA